MIYWQMFSANELDSLASFDGLRGHSGGNSGALEILDAMDVGRGEEEKGAGDRGDPGGLAARINEIQLHREALNQPLTG